MPGTSTNRYGGNVLLVGGILWAIAVVSHPDVSTFEKAIAASPGIWALSHWAYLLGDVLIIAGLLTLFRQLANGAYGGVAAVAFTGSMIGYVLDVVTTGNHLFAFPTALTASAPNAHAMFDTINTVNAGIGAAAVTCEFLGLLVLGYVLWKESWSSAVVLVTMVVGAFEFFLLLVQSVSGASLITSAIASYVAGVLPPLAFAFVGWEFRQRSPA